MTNAILFCPAGAVDLAAARAKVAYINRRGYTLTHLACHWAAVEQVLASGEVDVVVFAGTQGRVIGADDPASATQALRPALTQERVRDILDGATPPLGISPETLVAARRLARMIARHSA